MTLRPLALGLTKGGDAIAKFDDRAGNRCSLQMAVRLAPPPAPRKTLEPVVYLGVDGARMVLARERAIQVRDMLTNWLSTLDGET